MNLGGVQAFRNMNVYIIYFVGVVLLALLLIIYPYIIIVYLIIFILHKLQNNKIKELQLKFPTWNVFNHNLRRNYPNIVIGNSEGYWSIQNQKNKNDDILDLTLPEQSFIMQFDVLKHFFSIARDGGCVFLFLRESELCSVDKMIVLPFHYSILHPWLFPRTRKQKIKLRFSWLFMPLWLFKCLGVRIRLSQPKSQKNAEMNLNIIKEISRFCKERNLLFQMILLDKWHEDVLEWLRSENISFRFFEEFNNCR